jgi:hypothetical protein
MIRFFKPDSVAQTLITTYDRRLLQVQSVSRNLTFRESRDFFYKIGFMLHSVGFGISSFGGSPNTNYTARVRWGLQTTVIVISFNGSWAVYHKGLVYSLWSLVDCIASLPDIIDGYAAVPHWPADTVPVAFIQSIYIDDEYANLDETVPVRIRMLAGPELDVLERWDGDGRKTVYGGTGVSVPVVLNAFNAGYLDFGEGLFPDSELDGAYIIGRYCGFNIIKLSTELLDKFVLTYY